MDEQEIVLEGVYSSDVAKEYLQEHKKYRLLYFKSNIQIAFIAYIIFVLLRLTLLLTGRSYTIESIFFDTCIVLLGIWLVSTFIEQRTSFNSSFLLLNKKKLDRHKTHITILLADQKVVFVQSESRTELLLRNVQKVVIGTNAVLLFYSSYKFLWIPRSFSPSEEIWQKTISFVNFHVPEEKTIFV